MNKTYHNRIEYRIEESFFFFFSVPFKFVFEKSKNLPARGREAGERDGSTVERERERERER
jgi:hypothetical protein